MNSELSALLRLKEFRAERALRHVQAITRDLRAAEIAEGLALQRMRDSADSREEREEGVYRSIMRRSVDVQGIDEAKGRIKEIETQHMKLVDGHQRARHVLARIASELDVAAQAERRARQAVDKYVVLTEDLRMAIEARQSAVETEEIDEMFSLRRKRET